jgi:hypothetical protein
VLDFVSAVRASGVADTIQICTNGSLLHRTSEELFQAIDMLSVSWYPDSRCDEEKIRRAERLCKAHGTAIKVRRISSFRRMQVDRPIEDGNLVHEIYGACKIAHAWYCQTFADGRFYLCSRPIFTDAYLARQGEPTAGLTQVDGVPLHEPDLLRRLVAYLSADAPLAACSYCLGTVGRSIEWRQMSTDERRIAQPLARDAVAEVDRRQLALQRRTARLEGALKTMRTRFAGHLARAR